MSLLTTVGRMALSGIFINSGVNGLQNPGFVAQAVEQAGLPEPELLEKAHHLTNAIGGGMLALGIFPKLAALALAGNLIPTTVVAHNPTDADDEMEKMNQTIHAAKNLGLLGGLLMVLGGANDDDPVVVVEADELPFLDPDELD